MKRKAPVFLESAALSILGAWGAAGCLTSAFSLTVAKPQGMMLLWICWALLCACLLGHRWGAAALLPLARWAVRPAAAQSAGGAGQGL